MSPISTAAGSTLALAALLLVGACSPAGSDAVAEGVTDDLESVPTEETDATANGDDTSVPGKCTPLPRLDVSEEILAAREPHPPGAETVDFFFSPIDQAPSWDVGDVICLAGKCLTVADSLPLDAPELARGLVDSDGTLYGLTGWITDDGYSISLREDFNGDWHTSDLEIIIGRAPGQRDKLLIASFDRVELDGIGAALQVHVYKG